MRALYKGIASIFLGFAIANPTNALAYEKDKARSKALSSQITEIEWNLKNSSIARSIDKTVQDRALEMLSDAQLKLANGDFQTAYRLVERAALPLHEMSAQAMSGKHPDQDFYLNERREALTSISSGAEKIAREKREPLDFIDLAQRAQERSRQLESSGQNDLALKEIENAYRVVQSEIARMRNGNTFYLAIAPQTPDRQWSDGLSRFDERKQLTEILISEANADGIDASPLYSGLKVAEKLKSEATQMASEARYLQAVQSLEVAYLAFEDSWRQVGLDW